MKPAFVRTLFTASLVGAAVLPAIAIPLPDASSTASASTALSITNTGTGGAGAFQINNAANASYALQGLSNGSGISIYGYMTGTGRAGYFQISNPANNAYALTAVSNGTGISQYNLMSGLGRALYVQTSNAANTNNTFTALTNGKGSAALYQITNVTNTAPTLSAMTNGSGSAVQGLNTGTGRAGLFQLNNTTSTSHGVEATSNGLDYTVYSLNTGFLSTPNGPIDGGAGWFETDRIENTADTLVGKTNGIGYAVKGLNIGFLPGGEIGYSGGAGWFEIDREENRATDLVVLSNGRGNGQTIDLTNPSAYGTALTVNNQGSGGGVYSFIASQYSSAGYFNNSNSMSVQPTVYVYQQGTDDGLYSYVNNTAKSAVHGLQAGTGGNGVLGEALNVQGSGNGVKGVVNGSGYAGYFQGTGAASKGVYVSVPAANPGLNVVSGTKTAIVPTSSGARALYTEESSETWFTDYGFGKLEKGQATVEIDPTFAETVNLGEPYHVFLQSYGLSSLAVTTRTKSGFTVKVLSGEPDAEFSYRLVAKRRGHESKRLDRMPFADNDPNLLESKRELDREKQEAK